MLSLAVTVVLMGANSAPGLQQTGAGLGVIWRVLRAPRSVTVASIIRKTGTIRESPWTRTIPTGCSLTHTTSGLQRAQELSGMISPAVIPAGTHIPCTWISTRSHSYPDRPAFWRSETTGACTERPTRTLQTRPPTRPGLTWTPVLTRLSFILEISAATSRTPGPRRQAAGRRTTAPAR